MKEDETTTTSNPALHKRRWELIGFALMAIGLLVSMAILSYDAGDDDHVRRVGWIAVLTEDLLPVTNWLGLVGAKLAFLLVPSFLGYVSLGFSIFLMVVGYDLLRHRAGPARFRAGGLTAVGALSLASLIAWYGLLFEADVRLFTGAWGEGLALWTTRTLGMPGGVIAIIVAWLLTSMALIERDIQVWLDQLEQLFGRTKTRAETRPAVERGEAASEGQNVLEDDLGQSGEVLAGADNPSDDQGYSDDHPVDDLPREGDGVTGNDDFGPNDGDAGEEFDTADAPVTPPARTHVLNLGDTSDAEAAEDGADEALDAQSDDVEMTVQAARKEASASEIKRVRVPQYEMPPLSLLDASTADEIRIDQDEIVTNKRILMETLKIYNVDIIDINVIVGPTVTMFELTPAAGVKISKITALDDDLAMALAARGIRMIAPIPGKSAIGVEIPNRHRVMVRIRDMIATQRFAQNTMALPLILGKSIEGEVFLQDLTKMPHLLIAGATGSGKSVGLNTIITGLLYHCVPGDLKMVMIDPKKIELAPYAALIDQYMASPDGFDQPIITDFTQALGVLKSCEKEMEHRYDLLSEARVRSIQDYNRKVKEGSLSREDGHRRLPYIVVVVDELADLMMTAGKDIEAPIARLAQMARAVGIHLILATQRPSVDVITGLIKANFPARIAYQVASKTDSRTILDVNGAQGLVGNGDCLFMLGSRVVRLQGPFVSSEEIERVTEHVGAQVGIGPYVLPPIEAEKEDITHVGPSEDRDEFFEEAARIIVRAQQGSVSILQRKLSVGYSRAARLVDQLEEAGIVGPFEGSKARQVLVQNEYDLDLMFGNNDPERPIEP